MMAERVQINVRITPELARQLDTKRIELQATLDKIPSRSDVVRMALEEFLGKKKK
jgi:Arc/MetJ-type ribon-helix-helix transcriptional regulator